MRILIIKLSSIGDVVHALPTAYALKKHFVGAEIDWAVEPKSAPILREAEIVSNVLVVDKESWLREGLSAFVRNYWSFMGDLRRRPYDLVIDLQGLLKSSVIAAGSGAKRRLGYAWLREGAQFLVERVPKQPRSQHVIEIYLDVAAALGATTRPVQFPNLIRRTRFSEVDEALRKRGWDGEKGLVVVNPAAGWPSKEWPLARSVQAVRNIAMKLGMQPIVLCGPDRAQEVREICGGGLIVLAGDLSLGQLPALFAKCSLYIGYDTGPTHIAAAVGSKVICIMGPTDPARNGPYGGNAVTLWRCRKPRGCWVRRCDQRCIDDVTDDAVLRAADSLLAATPVREVVAR